MGTAKILGVIRRLTSLLAVSSSFILISCSNNETLMANNDNRCQENQELRGDTCVNVSSGNSNENSRGGISDLGEGAAPGEYTPEGSSTRDTFLTWGSSEDLADNVKTTISGGNKFLVQPSKLSQLSNHIENLADSSSVDKDNLLGDITLKARFSGGWKFIEVDEIEDKTGQSDGVVDYIQLETSAKDNDWRVKHDNQYSHRDRLYLMNCHVEKPMTKEADVTLILNSNSAIENSDEEHTLILEFAANFWTKPQGGQDTLGGGDVIDILSSMEHHLKDIGPNQEIKVNETFNLEGTDLLDGLDENAKINNHFVATKTHYACFKYLFEQHDKWVVSEDEADKRYMVELGTSPYGILIDGFESHRYEKRKGNVEVPQTQKDRGFEYVKDGYISAQNDPNAQYKLEFFTVSGGSNTTIATIEGNALTYWLKHLKGEMRSPVGEPIILNLPKGERS